MNAYEKFRFVSIVALLFLAVGAFGGGFWLIADPSGAALKIPLELLENTPFNNYLIPGILLFFANGVLSLGIAILAIKRAKYYPRLITLQGCILIGWLIVEALMNTEFVHPGLHYPLLAIGVLLIVSSFVVEKERLINAV